MIECAFVKSYIRIVNKCLLLIMDCEVVENKRVKWEKEIFSNNLSSNPGLCDLLLIS